tara:strand:+ start:252 stop:467 length:216 start_codon:yes stop_codon:yes gene_type:complete
MTNQSNNIEQSLKTIESFITQIESGDVSLEESLALYTKAIDLSSDTLKKIKQVETQFTMLKQKKDTLLNDQ